MKKKVDFKWLTLMSVYDDATQVEVVRITKKSKQYVSKITKKLIAKGYIRVKVEGKPAIYEITPLGRKTLKKSTSSQPFLTGCEKPKTVAHAIEIKFPILKDNPDAKFTKHVKVNHWIKKYVTPDCPFDLTIEKTTKSIIVHAHNKEFDKTVDLLNEYVNWVTQIKLYISYYMEHKHGIVVDVVNSKVTDQHIENDAREYEEKLDKNNRWTEKYDWKAVAPWNLMEQQAKAYIDYSPGPHPRIGTNDLLYEKLVLDMPVTLNTLATAAIPVLGATTAQMQLHLNVMNDMKDTLKDIRNALNPSKKRKRAKITTLIEAIDEIKKQVKTT